MAATAMLSSMVCSRIFSLTIKQCAHHKKETKKYTSIPLSSTFSQVFQTYYGPADPEFHVKVWCSERGHEEGHEIDDTETAVFNIVNLFPVKYITFSCLKRAVEEPHMEEGNQETAQCLNAFDFLMQHRLDYVEPKSTRLVSKYT